MSRILYSGNRNASSWAFRAWLALKEQGVDFEEIIIDIRRPQRWGNLSKIAAFSPPGAVPVLVDGDSVIYDSNAIMEYAHELGETNLLPDNLIKRAQTRSLVAWQHSNFSKVCPCLSFESTFYKEKKCLTRDEINSIESVYALWETSLTQSNEELIEDDTDGYLMGEFSLADIALIPSVLRFSSHYQVPSYYPMVANWIERLLNRAYVKQWLDQAYALEPIYIEGYYHG